MVTHPTLEDARGGGGGDLPWNVCRGGVVVTPPTLEGARGGGWW